MSRGRTAQTEEPVPESDRLEGCEHPRAQQYLFGHQRAARILADAARRGSLPHAVLISGPKGVGKATLAWRLIRALMGRGRGEIADDLGMPSAVPAAALIEKLSHPDIMLLRRLWDDRAKKFGAEIPVDEVRRLSAFLGRHSAQGGWRIAIIDVADDLSRGAENALLKTLEEPPAQALIILVSHAPGSLLPTTRSRCWHIALRPLEQEEMAHALRT
ncbi:MAG TPA: DNA polymerase III subunit delta', partial [Alphaproteobacteria bacterium]|nr:DNA polymerase III subunit delta' [Alphaproteobacteria bacterium]